MKRLLAICFLLCLAGCAADDSSQSDANTADTVATVPLPGIVLQGDSQRVGDPALGYKHLVNSDYVRCGVPYSAYKAAFGNVDLGPKLPGREGLNADLPFMSTAFKTDSGVDVVAPNCLTCHAEMLEGKLVVGLGTVTQDFTIDLTAVAALSGLLVKDGPEKEEWKKWNSRVQAVGPYIRTLVVGVNMADNMASALWSHRDPKTLNWSDEPLMEKPPKMVVPVDVPPWWRMGKKATMFYTGAGRGDHARIMVTASTLCTDTVEEAKQIDAYFHHVRA